MADIKIVYQEPENLKEYQNNPRYNDDAVKAVAESIKEFGFKNPSSARYRRIQKRR